MGCSFLQVDAAALEKLRSIYYDEVRVQFEVRTGAGIQWRSTYAML